MESLNSHPIYVERIAQYIKGLQGECIILQIKGNDINDPKKLFVQVAYFLPFHGLFVVNFGNLS
jgi:hypothetical protein